MPATEEVLHAILAPIYTARKWYSNGATTPGNCGLLVEAADAAILIKS